MSKKAMTTETRDEILARISTAIEKVINESEETVTYIEKPVDTKSNAEHPIAHEQRLELQKLLDSKAPDLPRVVVRCDRKTGKWNLFHNDKPWKQMQACVLVNVHFACEWLEGENTSGCGWRGGSDGEYIGYAAGDLLPIGVPVTVPKQGVTALRFDPDDGKFYDPETGHLLKGSGYLILKDNCSSEYVGAKAIGAQKGNGKKK